MPDLMAQIVAYLATAVAAPVSTQAPETPPARYVVITRSGGSSTLFTLAERLTVDAIGTSDADAAALLRSVTDALLIASDHIEDVYRATVESTYRSSHDSTDQWSASVTMMANRQD